MGKLTGRTIVITGAARGQGAAEVAALAAAGAAVIATDVLDFADTELSGLSGLSGLPGDVTYRRLDVADEKDWAGLAEWLRTERGSEPGSEHGSERGLVHGLVNNAGIPMRHRLGEVPVDDWNRALAVNLTGPMLGMQTLAPFMPAGASIVNVGSVAGLTAHHAVAYTASKWALRGLTRAAATEYGRRGIRVNIVHPGAIDTPILAGADPVFLNAHLALTPLGRTGLTSDIAPLVTFLLSDEAGYITGAEIAVDGGYAAHGGTKVIIDALDR